MIKRKHSNYFLVVAIVLLLLSWTTYSFFFKQIYDEAKIFATSGAQPIVKILEILNYRMEELLPYFIMFFTLTSLSLLFLVYLFLFIKKYSLKMSYVISLSCLVFVFMGINIANDLFAFLLLLIGVAALIIASVTLTVKFLYIDAASYEEGDIIQTKGPFKTEKDAEEYAKKAVAKFKKEINIEQLDINSSVFLENAKDYYVEIYIERINNDSNEWSAKSKGIDGESREENEEKYN